MVYIYLTFWLREGEKRSTENEMIGWHHPLSGHEFKQTLGDDEGQRSLACCSTWDHRVRHNLSSEQQTFFTQTVSISTKNKCRNQ